MERDVAKIDIKFTGFIYGKYLSASLVETER